jgi:hypothetical protein
MDYFIGRVGILPDVFWRNTWAENALMSEAYQTKENKEWERTRLLVSMIHNVNCTKKAQMIKPKDVIELPIDKIKRKKSLEPKGDLAKVKALEEKLSRAKWMPINKL